MKFKCLLFFIISILVSSAHIYAAAENEQEKNKVTNIFYEFKKDGKLKGYILGTMHTLKGYEKFTKISKKLTALLQNITTMYFEIVLKSNSPGLLKKHCLLF